MSRTSTKFTVFICNIVITVLCIAVIASYFFLPFWQANVSFRLTAETLESVIGEDSSGGANSELPENRENPESSPLDDINITEAVGEEGITLSLSITLKTADVLSSLTGDSTNTAQTVLDENVNGMVEQLADTLNTVGNKVLESTAKETIRDALHEQVNSIYEGSKNPEEVKELLEEAGINDEYVDQKADQLFSALNAENASVDSVADETVAIVEEALAKMESVDDSQDFTLSETDKEELRTNICEILENIAKEDGSINMEDFMASLLLKALEESEETENEESAEPQSKLLAKALEEETGTEKPFEVKDNAMEELKISLKNKIMGLIGDDAVEQIATVFKYVSHVIIFTLFTWSYLILKILVKLGAKNNAIKLKLPIWLGSIPFWVLYLLPTLAISLLKNPPAALTDLMGAEAMAEMSGMLSGLEASFFTCAWVSFIAGFALVLFSIFFYSRQRRKLKKYKKGLLSDDE